MAGSEVIGDLIIKLLILLIVARVFGWLATLLKQPSVLGELIAGVILGPSLLGIIQPLSGETGLLSTHLFMFLAEIGIIILLFQVGLESNLHKLIKIGPAAALVAFAGVVFPFLFGYLLFTSLGYETIVAVFIGATLTATSVGITMRVLEDMHKINTNEARIILAAADIDDVLALITLSVIIGVIEVGVISYFNIGKIIVFAVVFLVASFFAGFFASDMLYKIFQRLKVARTFVFTSLIFALTFAYIANAIGLATIVGAFVAGLALQRSKDKVKIHHRIQTIGSIFVPIFFVMAGVMLDIRILFDTEVLPLILGLLAIAVVGKMLAGLFAFGKVKVNKLAIGLGMIPRGEVGLIFATYGLTYGVITQNLYAIIVVVVMLTTFVTPTPLELVMEKVKSR